MPKIILNLLFVIINLLCYVKMEDLYSGSELRSLKSKSTDKTKKKSIDSSKENSKILQTLYSDSSSNNYYYTTLYIGEKKIKQTYFIDTGTATMSSPCGPCDDCGKNKNNYFDKSNKKGFEPLKCSSKICKMVSATGCLGKEKKIKKQNCTFFSKKENGDGLSGYYLENIVYFEENKDSNNSSLKKVYKSHALPLGCTLKEYGKYKSIITDGVLGINNEGGSFISILYNLKIINKNIFSLCFGQEGGYMSIGEIDTPYHYSKEINYVELLNSTNYLILINGIKVGNNKIIRTNIVGDIDSGSTLTYFPKKLYNSVKQDFEMLCADKEGYNTCGKFYTSNMGYCASFKKYKKLLKAIKRWPNITLALNDNKEYIWEPINYFYYYHESNKNIACLGFFSHNYEKITLGTNFFHGHDIIFNRDNQKLGYVPANCLRQNINISEVINTSLISKDNNIIPEIISKEVPINENKKKFLDNKENVEFVKGNNKELDIINDSKLIPLIKILIVILIIVIALLITIIILIIYKRNNLNYQNSLSDENKKLYTEKKVVVSNHLNTLNK